ncbi:hypothetical protein GGF50DRAFT_121512 [Schizophyllum commune]
MPCACSSTTRRKDRSTPRPSLPRLHGRLPLADGGKAEDSLSPFIFFMDNLYSQPFNLNPDFMVTFFLLSPGHVDDVRGEGRCPRHDDSSAPTNISASSEFIVADGELSSHDLPDATTLFHSPSLSAPDDAEVTTPRSTPAVTRGRNLVDVEIISRSFWRPPSYTATLAFCSRSTTRTHSFETAACVTPHVSSVALLASSTLALTSAHATARAPSALSRNDAGTLSLPPTTILDDLALVPVAAAPRMRSTRDSQAEEITLDTTARPSHEGSRPSSATRNDPRVGYRRHSLILAALKPPEAFARTLGEGCGRGGGPLPPRHEHFSQIPNRRRQARAPSAKDAAGVGYPLLPFI